METYLLHPLKRSISMELYKARPFPISISSHSFGSYSCACVGKRRDETLLVKESNECVEDRESYRREVAAAESCALDPTDIW